MKRLPFTILTAAGLLLGSLAGFALAQEPLYVFGAYATAIEEPWDGVIHTALSEAENEGAIVYQFVDDIG